MVVEQRKNDEFRNKYDDKLKSFIKTKHKSLLYERKYNGVYGWIVGYGEPPKKHLDVLLLTNKEYNLGDIIEIKIIGVFLRNDHDNKFIALEKKEMKMIFLN